MYKLSPYMEGIINDALKTSLDVDPDAIKQEWERIDQQGGTGYDKATALNDKGLGAAADTIEDINKTAGKQKVDTRSIITRAKNSVLQFPVYVSQSLRVNEAHIISKLFERVYASYVQTVIAQNPIMTEREANDLVFLQKFHTNINEAAELYYNEFYEPIDDLDQIIQESTYSEIPLGPNLTLYFCKSGPDNRITYESKRLAGDLLEGFPYLEANTEAEEKILSKTVKREEPVDDAEFRNKAMDELGLKTSEKELIDMTVQQIEQRWPPQVPGVGGRSREAERRINAREKLNQDIDDKIKEMKNEIKSAGKNGKDGIRFSDGRYVRISTSQDTTHETNLGTIKAPTMLKDVEIKKLNGMLPWNIEVHFRVKTDKGDFARDVHYLIGIKTVLHSVDVMDLTEELRDLVTGDIKSLQKVRYKSGEIKFWDYVLNVKQIKRDAVKGIQGNKKWLNTLKRNSEFRKSYGGLLKSPAQWINGKKPVPIPNGTMMITQTDVDILKNQTGIDLNSVGNVKRLCASLFLIAFGIIDSAAGTMKVLFPDTDSHWDVQSLSQVDAELAKSDNSKLMSELNKMVNRV